MCRHDYDGPACCNLSIDHRFLWDSLDPYAMSVPNQRLFSVETEISNFPNLSNLSKQTMPSRWYSLSPNRWLLSFCFAELAHAIVTTGRPACFRSRPHNYFWEVVHRLSLLLAYLDFSVIGCTSHSGPSSHIYGGNVNYIGRSHLFSMLVASEKSVFSYMLGQAMTGLFTRIVLGINYLQHLEWSGCNCCHCVLTINSRSSSQTRPDFAGLLPGTKRQWILAEAKGRSGTCYPKALQGILQKARIQLNNVVYVNKVRPSKRIACVTHFSYVCRKTPKQSIHCRCRKKVLTLWVDDPPIDGPGLDIEIDYDLSLLRYYHRFQSLIDCGLDFDDAGQDNFTTSLLLPGLRIGLLTPIYSLVKNTTERISDSGDDENAYQGFERSVRTILSDELADGETGLFNDGTMVAFEPRT